MFLIFPIIIGLIFAWIGSSMARSRNRDPVLWAIICFFLCLIGVIILLIVGKDNSAAQQSATVVGHALPQAGADMGKWAVLKEVDADIRAAAARMLLLGERYEQLLASKYLVLNDKTYLPSLEEAVAKQRELDAAAEKMQEEDQKLRAEEDAVIARERERARMDATARQSEFMLGLFSSPWVQGATLALFWLVPYWLGINDLIDNAWSNYYNYGFDFGYLVFLNASFVALWLLFPYAIYRTSRGSALVGRSLSYLLVLAVIEIFFFGIGYFSTFEGTIVGLLNYSMPFVAIALLAKGVGVEKRTVALSGTPSRIAFPKEAFVFFAVGELVGAVFRFVVGYSPSLVTHTTIVLVTLFMFLVVAKFLGGVLVRFGRSGLAIGPFRLVERSLQ